MSVRLGSGPFQYEPVEGWESLPPGVRPIECPGVAVDARDQVYVLTRNVENPVLVFNREGDYLGSWGQGIFSARTHAIELGPDGTLWCVDDGSHTVRQFTPAGAPLLTLATPDQPAPRWSGRPFNRPTDVAVSAQTGCIYVTDGYGNACVHKFSPSGDLITSWGEPGIDAGQFILPHNLAIDSDDRVIVAERESHRVQVFDADGRALAMWNNIFRPDGLTIGPDGNIYICELNGGAGYDDAPGVGHRVSILSPAGQLLARFGDAAEGEGPGQFIAPHGIAVDSRGDIYIGEVSFTIRGRRLEPPRELKSLRKFRKVNDERPGKATP